MSFVCRQRRRTRISVLREWVNVVRQALLIRALCSGRGQRTSNRFPENAAAGSSVRADSIQNDESSSRNPDILRSKGRSSMEEETRSEGGQMSLSIQTTTGDTAYFTSRSNGGFSANVPTDTATVPEARPHVPEVYQSGEARDELLAAQRTHWVMPSCAKQRV